MKKLRPQAVIFDLGSTLIEYESVPWDELNIICAGNCFRYLAANGHKLPEETSFIELFNEIRQRYRNVAIKSLVEWTIPQVATELLTQLGIDPTTEAVEKFFDAYYAPVAERLSIYDDTIETLEKIRQLTPNIGLISNTIFPERAHRAELHRFGIEPFLKFTIFSSTFGVRKPHPDIFLRAAKLAGVAPEESVYIGDRYLEDITGPQSVGMAAILKIVKGRKYPDPLPESVRQINRMSDLTRHLDI